MWPDLVLPNDLVGFPGAPFLPAVVSAAAGAVRDECGWHIAPEFTETVRERVSGCTLILRTLHLVEVLSVTDSHGEEVEVEYAAPSGVVTLKRPVHGLVTVVFSHGFEACPPALLGVVAEGAQRVRRGQVRQESLGSRSVAYGAAAEVQAAYDPVVARYRLGPRP